MSAFGMLAYPSGQVFVATDTLSCILEPIVKNGEELPETLHSLSEKSIYLPHIQAVVCCLGASFMSDRYHQFIDDHYAMTSLDELVLSTEDKFCKTMLSDDAAKSFVLDDKAHDFIGAIMLIGVSALDIDLEKGVAFNRKEKRIVAFKLSVYKDRVVKTILNPNPDGFTYCFHPPLSQTVMDGILDEHERIGHDSVIHASQAILIDMMKEAHRMYHESGRQTMVTGGEVNIHILNHSETLFVTSYTAHRFSDFDECRAEIIGYHRNRKP